MANVKHIHISDSATLASQLFSTTPTDDYVVSIDNMTVRTGTPTINYADFCFCKPINSVYTHGQFYGEISVDDYQYIGSVYGVQWNTNDVSPDCTRIGNLSNHASLPIQSKLVGGLMTDAGVFTEFSNQSDWTSFTRDGSAGQVMVKIPRFYIKYETEGTINRVLMSLTPVLGFQVVPEMYIGAYEGAMDRTNNKLCSVRNSTAQYRGGNNQSAWDSEDTAGNGGESHRSQLGRPATNISLTNFRTYAKNRGTNWIDYTYEMHKILYWLYVVEYATLNSQKAYNASLTSLGYHQGGLGDGITTWNGDLWNAFNNYYPLVPCGYLDEYGNGTAVKTYTVYNGDGTVAKTFTNGAIKYRGIEHPFGHIWKWTDGILVNVTNSTSPIYVCKEISKFASTLTEDYEFLDNEFRTQNYFTKITFGSNGDITASSASGIGNSSSYYCDYHYTNTSSASLRGLLFGGNAYYGAYAGFVYSSSYYAPSGVAATVGSRLCLVNSAI